MINLDTDTALALFEGVIDSLDDMAAIFAGEKPILINGKFKKFFGVSSARQYNDEFGAFVNNFVPHPSYFHAQKVQNGESWMDAIMRLGEIERVVSMMTSSYEPCAFSVKVQKVDDYAVVLFHDITRTLIKRIMIENHTSIDSQSGAYAKNYFLHISQNFQDAARFSEKRVCAILVKSIKKEGSDISKDTALLKEITTHLRSLTRQDDMLIRWGDDEFLLVFLADGEANAKAMLEKLSHAPLGEEIKEAELAFKLAMQKEGTGIKSFVDSVSAG